MTRLKSLIAIPYKCLEGSILCLGYVCCNEVLNDLMVETFAEMEARPKFHTCNIQAVANQLQV